MDEPKPVTRWASASLECSVLSWACGILLVIFAVGPSTGVIADIVLLCAAGLTYLLCAAGAFAGIVALVRIRSDGYGGWASAWAGLLLGDVPVLASSCCLLRAALYFVAGGR